MKVIKGERRRARIEIIPLIDVTFLLLVFFIYISLFMSINQGIPLQLPYAETGELKQADRLEVSVNQEGQIFLDQAPVPTGAFVRTIRDRIGVRGTKQVSLRGDGEVDYERIVEVLDLMRSAGVVKVTLETRQRQ
jgi:biopolymer transport protein ExbD